MRLHVRGISYIANIIETVLFDSILRIPCRVRLTLSSLPVSLPQWVLALGKLFSPKLPRLLLTTECGSL